MDCAESEEVYLRSKFIRECCLVRIPSLTAAEGTQWHAVVVPDMAMMHDRRIANVGDLLRFEIEGQSIDVPPDRRAASYEIWFEALPRTSDGRIDRHEIERRVVESQRQQPIGREERGVSGFSDGTDFEKEALAVIAARAKGSRLTPHSNLEIDLGLDSIDRVELISELERRFGVTVPQEGAHQILTVSQLIDAVCPIAIKTLDASSADPPGSFWKTMLRDLPARNDPVLASTLKKRLVVPTMFFVLLRVARWLMPGMKVFGVDGLPASGPYILAPNHQSYLDPLFLCSTLPYGMYRQLFFVGATEYFETRWTAWMARQLNLVPVDPDANLVSAMQAAAFGLTHGKVLVLFPEGERSIDGTVKRFKKGAAILSRCLNVPVVPVAIRGVHEVWPRNRGFQWHRLLPWNHHRIAIAFGQPMRFNDACDSDAATELQKRVTELWASLTPSPERGEHAGAGNAAGEEDA